MLERLTWLIVIGLRCGAGHPRKGCLMAACLDVLR